PFSSASLTNASGNSYAGLSAYESSVCLSSLTYLNRGTTTVHFGSGSTNHDALQILPDHESVRSPNHHVIHRRSIAVTMDFAFQSTYCRSDVHGLPRIRLRKICRLNLHVMVQYPSLFDTVGQSLRGRLVHRQVRLHTHLMFS